MHSSIKCYHILTTFLKKLRFSILLTVAISSFCFSQTQEATLHFYDGTSIEGYGLIFQNNKIKFRVSLEDKPDVWDGIIVSGITFHGFEYDIKFNFVYTKNHKKYPLLLEVLTEGEVTLYANVITKNNYTPAFGIDNDRMRFSNSYATVKYYVKREEEALATKLKGRFKKCIIAYFGECSGLIKGIENHEFRWATMINLVNYYNDFCVD